MDEGRSDDNSHVLFASRAKQNGSQYAGRL